MLATALDRYNETLLSSCGEKEITCMDVADMLPKDTRTFYDDVHFNEQGAKRLAEILVRHLVDDPLFQH